MRRPRQGNAALNVALLLCLVGFFAPSPVSSISVSTPAELYASKGDAVTLSCTFTSTSRPTSKMTVDWSYRPQSGGPPQTTETDSYVVSDFKLLSQKLSSAKSSNDQPLDE